MVKADTFKLAVGLCLGIGLAVPPVAHAAPKKVLNNPSALRHFEKAQDRFNQEDYEGAIPELKAAYAIEPNPMLLYAWAQAERLSGDCRKAIELYEKFLTFDPDQQQRQLAEANIVDCEAELGDEPDTTVPPPPPDQDPDTIEPDQPPPPPQGRLDRDKPWHRDWVAGTLLGVGAASVVAGGVLMGVGKSEVDASANAPSEGDYFDQSDAGQQKFTAGTVVLSVGGALLVGGIVRLAILGTRARNNRADRGTTAGVMLDGQRATLSIGGRF